MAKRPEKFQFRVYRANGRPLYAEGNMLFSREYATRASANRAVAPVRKQFPGSVGEIARFELLPVGFWTCRGGDDVDRKWDDRA